ncbi:MAG: DNA repair protein RecO [Pseudomonadota bacterium]
MEWREDAILLAARPHGESSAIIDVFTPTHGRHAGVVRGGTSRKIAPILQPGAQLEVIWRARLEEHIGSFSVEPVRSRAAVVMGDRQALAGLNAVTALLRFSLPERAAFPALYSQSRQLLDLLDRQDVWPLAYLQWEVQLLETLGYGLSLGHCAVTGQTEDLVYVSPKSGRAVSRKAAGSWADRLLPLPGVLRGAGDSKDAEIAEALKTTGYFLETRLAAGQANAELPRARKRFVETFTRGI